MNRDQIGLIVSLSALGIGYLYVNSYYISKQQKETPNNNITLSTPISNTPIAYAPTAIATINVNTTLTTPPIIQSNVPVNPLDLVINNKKLNIVLSELGGCINNAQVLLYKERIGSDNTMPLFAKHDNCKAYGTRLGSQDLRSLPAQFKKLSPTSVNITQLSPNNIEVSKTFDFKNDSYQGTLDITVTNRSNIEQNTSVGIELGAQSEIKGHGGFLSKHPLQQHSVLYSIDGKVERTALNFDDQPAAKLLHGANQIRPQWVGTGGMYFLSALLPQQNNPINITTASLGTLLQTNPQAEPDQTTYESWMDTSIKLAPGTSKNFKYSLYLGPKLKSELDNFSEKELSKAVDYGFFSVISWPLFYLLAFIHKMVQNWGVAIVILTALVKILLYPLAQKSYIAGRKMQKIQPEIKAIQEKHKDDKQKANQEVMAIMSQKGANPLSGCLPILPQLPIFFGLYSVFQQTFELRQAPFIFWIKDLSAMDPFFVLPVLIAVLYYVQQKLTPMAPGMDPTQQKMMQILPFVFSFMMITFPSGLALYITTNTVLSILQQWYMLKRYKNI